MPTNWRSKYRTLLKEQDEREKHHDTIVERLRRENDVLRDVVRAYASEEVDWCHDCYIPMLKEDSTTCRACSSVLCEECFKYDRDRGCDQCGNDNLCPHHSIQTCGACNERWCDDCTRKKMVPCSHIREDEEQPHLICENCVRTCAGCSVVVCRECADICEYCDDYKNANVYCDACSTQHWCTSCDMVVCLSCRPTCVQCRTGIVGTCSDCATESIHDLDECEEVMCRSCRQETLVQIYGNLKFD